MMNLSIFNNLAGNNLVAICAFSFFGIVLGYFVFCSAREWSTLYYLSRNGELIEAKIKNVTTHNTGRGSTYFIEYEYDVESLIYKGKQQISRKHYQQFRQQDCVTVRFAQTRRHWSRLAKSDFDNTYRNFSSFAAFMGCLFFLPYILLWISTLLGMYWYLVGVPIPAKKNHFDT